MVRCVACLVSRSVSVSGPGAERRLTFTLARCERTPEAVEEAAAPLDHLLGLLGPVHVVERRPDEKMEEAQPVGAHRLVVMLGRNEIALGLGHLGAVHADHALREIPLERLTGEAGGEAHIDQGPGEEAGVQQVQDGVLDTADVLIDGHPAARCGRIEGPVIAPRIAVAQEVPRGVDERVHGVGLASSGATTERTRRVEETLVKGQRRLPRREELDVIGRHHRQLLLGYGDRPVLGAVDHRNRASPESLP